MSNDLIKAISFDAAGTIIHLAEPVGNAYSRVAKRHGISASPNSLDRAFSLVWSRTPLPFSPKSTVDHPNEKSWWKSLVSEVFEEAQAGIFENHDFEAFFKELYDHFEAPGTWTADPDATYVLSTVSKNYPVIILSNFDYRLRRILGDLKLLSYFRYTLLSCEIGASKPDPKIFAEAASKLALPAETILHVGDDPECDWNGAKNAGFKHFRIGRKENSLRSLLGELSLA